MNRKCCTYGTLCTQYASRKDCIEYLVSHTSNRIEKRIIDTFVIATVLCGPYDGIDQIKLLSSQRVSLAYHQAILILIK